jgi:hypothetical protein
MSGAGRLARAKELAGVAVGIQGSFFSVLAVLGPVQTPHHKTEELYVFLGCLFISFSCFVAQGKRCHGCGGFELRYIGG